jgi:4-hydroxythreonine-4-phosphate dehydrogenase
VSRSGPLRIGVTVGDPAGIGPEVLSSALRGGAARDATVVVYGDLAAVERAGGLPDGVQGRRFATAPVRPGAPDPATAAGVIEAIQTAARDCLAGELDAIVTAPISKEIWGSAGYDWPGHTELLEATAGRGRAVMMLAGAGLRVVPATIHCALREVPGRLSQKGLLEIFEVLATDLPRRFGLAEPRIAVCGLNPHASDGGRFGDEEQRVIGPAVEAARAKGIDARGPFAADTLFFRAAHGEFDVVVGMYHDQVLGPLKLHAFGRGVNVTLGLPLVRTSPDHGTAFDIAGQGRADDGSMREAFEVALEMAGNERRARA